MSYTEYIFYFSTVSPHPTHPPPHLLLCALSQIVSSGRVLWLQLQQSPEEVF